MGTSSHWCFTVGLRLGKSSIWHQTDPWQAHGTGPNPYKVAIALEILQLPYQVKLWDFGGKSRRIMGLP